MIPLPPTLSDLQMEFGCVPLHLDAITSSGVLWEVADGQFLLRVPNVARYFVERGERITIQPDPEAQMMEVKRFAAMTPLAAAAYQRGRLVLNAATVVNGSGDAVAFTGIGVSGKSTLAMSLLLHGWRLLSDDLAVISWSDAGGPIAEAADSGLWLWPDAAAGLSLPSAKDSGRTFHQVENPKIAGPSRLKAIVRLGLEDGDRASLEAELGAKAVMSAGYAIYNRRIALAIMTPVRIFELLAEIVRTTSSLHLRRPLRGWSVDDVTRRFLEWDS